MTINSNQTVTKTVQFEIECPYENGEPVKTDELEVIENSMSELGLSYVHKQGGALAIYVDGKKRDTLLEVIIWMKERGYYQKHESI